MASRWARTRRSPCSTRDRAKVLEALNYVLSPAQAGLTEMRALIFELRPNRSRSKGWSARSASMGGPAGARHGIEVEVALWMSRMCRWQSKRHSTGSPKRRCIMPSNMPVLTGWMCV